MKAKNQFKKFILVLISVGVFSFLLNFLWESLHGFSLYTNHVIDSDKYVHMMVYMSFMDAVTVLGIYFLLAFFIKDVFWLNEINLKRFVIFFILGIIVGTFVEYRAVYVSHEWHYNQYMPMIFGVGLSPFLQLGVTGCISLWLSKKLIGKNKSCLPK